MNDSARPILEARALTKRFGGFTAVESLDFVLGEHERVGLIGPNGSGKSTFVNALTGVFAIDEGTVLFDGSDITRLKPWERARLGLSRSFQIPRPFKGQTVRENIEIPLMFAVGHRDPDRVQAEAEKVLAQVGLLGRADASPKSLTQVELRKMELGRALAAKPRVLIADESMAGLSDTEVDEVLEVLLKLNAEGISIVLIEHIMRAVVRFSQRIVVLVAGQKIADGEPGEVMSHPEVERAYLGQ
ncbi:MAG TPA: ABC transporter ATP-binding protein [Xanthobacteraceae bacterium]|nr:ABC transporter ATP-binding protein [Xanthobacteraceae bacterium]